MLYQLGAVTIEVWPFNVTDVGRNGDSGFAEKAVIGRMQVLEAVGDNNDTITLTGKQFPQKLGGLAELELMRAQKAAQVALPLVRGDFTPLGWFVITSLQDRSSILDGSGVGKVIDVEIGLKRSSPPGAASIFGVLAGLFG